MQEKKYAIEMTEQEVNTVLNALTQQPYYAVADLIRSIFQQVSEAPADDAE